MLNAKKIDMKTIALIVVSTLLVVSLTLAGTMAWFTQQDNASGTLGMGQAIVMRIDEKDTTDGHFKIVVDGNQLLPGMKFAPDLSVIFTGAAVDQITTAALLRATFTVTVGGTGGQTYADALLGVFKSRVTETTGWVFNEDDDYFYYIGKTGDAAYVMTTTAEGLPVSAAGVTGPGAAINGNTGGASYVPAVTRAAANPVANTVLASVAPASGSSATIIFLNPGDQWIRIPSEWDDELAGRSVEINFNVEAIQDYLVTGGPLASTDTAPTIAAMKTALGD